MGNGFARGLSLLMGLGLLGSTAAGAVTTGIGWPVMPFVTISALLGLLWGLSFIRAGIPASPAAPDLQRRLQSMVEAVSVEAGVATPRAYVSTRAAGATVAFCKGAAQLCFPSVWVEKLTDAQLRACVTHEIAHTRQPQIRRRSGSSWANIIASWNLGLAVGVVINLTSPGGLDARRSIYVVYALAPLVMTGALALRRLVQIRALLALEYDADRQTVASGVPVEVLAATLMALATPELTPRMPWDRRLLLRIALYYIPGPLEKRASRLTSP